MADVASTFERLAKAQRLVECAREECTDQALRERLRQLGIDISVVMIDVEPPTRSARRSMSRSRWASSIFRSLCSTQRSQWTDVNHTGVGRSRARSVGLSEAPLPSAQVINVVTMSKARSHYHMRKSPNSEGSPGWHDWLSRFAGTAIAVIVYLIVHGS